LGIAWRFWIEKRLKRLGGSRTDFSAAIDFYLFLILTSVFNSQQLVGDGPESEVMVVWGWIG
jgi:hypothetical protein